MVLGSATSDPEACRSVDQSIGAIAQMVERLNRTQEVSGSNPLSSTPVLLP